jgi:hypothetical protein
MHRTRDIIAAFDAYLEACGLHFDAVVIGGAALNLLGVVSRLTKDCDILFPEIPAEIAQASQTFACEVRGMAATLAANGSIMGRLRCKDSFPQDGKIAFKPHFQGGLSTYVPWHEKISYVRSYSLFAIVALISWTASRSHLNNRNWTRLFFGWSNRTPILSGQHMFV